MMIAVVRSLYPTKRYSWPLNKAIRVSAVIFFAAAPSMLVAQESPSLIDLAGLSLEDLANIQITTVSRREQNLSATPASVYVITADDIQRSGATTLPELLRLAPNLQVARLDNAQYAITARGFNNAIGNKLLVLVDGRTVYTPLFSGVFWEMQDIMPEHIERIEVISGPGATMWGANAVNGIINVITRHTQETLGTLVVADMGDSERGLSLSTGGSAGTEMSFRVYGKFRDWENTHRADHSAADDGWKRSQAGFRADWAGDDESISVQGDIFQGESEHRGFFGPLEVPAIEVSGANLLASWEKQLNNGSELRVRAYWSRTEREELVIFSPDAEILDLDIQHGFTLGNHSILWGGGYRQGDDDVEPGLFSAVLPSSRDLRWENLFVHDEILLTERLRAIVGVKLEWNDYTGMEYLPTARLSWNAADNHTLWAAVSRAVRAPSRFDRDVYLPQTPPFIIAGGPEFESEVAKVYSLGYRGQASEMLNYSITLFRHDWEKLRSGTPLPLPAYLVNNIKGDAYGVEAWANWQITDFWRLSGGFSTIEKNLRFERGKTDTAGINNATLHNDPDHHWLLHSSIDMTDNLTFDLHLRGVAQLSVEPVPAYTELSARVAWQPLPNLEISLSGQNLLNGEHAEFGAAANRSEFGRSVLVGIRWSP